MARPRFQDLSPWRRYELTIPPDSLQAWVALAGWEFWMGVLVCAALGFGTQLIVTAPDSIVTVFDSDATAMPRHRLPSRVNAWPSRRAH
jgi:hypothetical protein